MPCLTDITFNGQCNRSELKLCGKINENLTPPPPPPSSSSTAPGLRVFVLGSKLKRGGLNTLNIETKSATPGTSTANRLVINGQQRPNPYAWQTQQPASPDELENKVGNSFRFLSHNCGLISPGIILVHLMLFYSMFRWAMLFPMNRRPYLRQSEISSRAGFRLVTWLAMVLLKLTKIWYENACPVLRPSWGCLALIHFKCMLC